MLEGLEAKWSAAWERAGTYRFDRSAPRERVFAIDTPPPTVSGSLHVGHVFSYTHTDCVARYRRMQGDEVFYPMGWDDNGLPTERRVQNHFGVRCDPGLRYEPDLRLPERPADAPVAVSRRNFVELCERLTAEDEQAFEQLWRMLGLSVDWTQTYATIDARARRVSQRAFLRLVRRGHAYLAESPTLWDVDFQTAVSQAELADVELEGRYHRLAFAGEHGAPGLEVDTTRPELLPACVAVVVHPDDSRYRSLVGSTVRTPLFSVRVPVLAHPLADPDKGTGAAMVCTFGDMTDVAWWRELGLPTRVIVGRDGRLVPVDWRAADRACADPDGAARAYGALEGLDVAAARVRIVELLRQAGALLGEPRPVRHVVKFYERGERPLEIVTSRQWFIRVLPMKERLLALGRQLRWHPPQMLQRYESWVEGLTSDWNVSRQRFFGVPFPVWYPVGEDGVVDYEHPILPSEDRLPVDPSEDVPEGFEQADRGRPGGFVGDPDVMDTWATSSLTPQIAGGWEEDPDLFARVFPMHLRPQSHEIIRTWLFTTVLRAELEHGTLPWSDVAISGWVLDPFSQDRKKMSKSSGRVITPMGLLERHGADAVRYWAASGRPGVDTAFDENQMRVGRRLAIKVLNASRFVLGRLASGFPPPEAVTRPIDRAFLARLAGVVERATAAFEELDYARALEVTETCFWSFCDDYLELVKARAYEEAMGDRRRASALGALGLALSTFHRLFAPFLPFVAEEVWSWWHDGSVHRAPWPRPEELKAALDGQAGSSEVFDVVAEVLGEVRRAKTDAKRSLKAPVARVEVADEARVLDMLGAAEDDLKAAGCIDKLVLKQAERPEVRIELAD
jgi:valyl-tRNA synthetase